MRVWRASKAAPEGRLGGGRLRQQEDAARVLVEAMDDAGAIGVEGGGLFAIAVGEPVRDAGGAGFGGGGVDEQAGALVDGEEIGVFVQDGEGKAAGGSRRGGALGDDEVDPRAALDLR